MVRAQKDAAMLILKIQETGKMQVLNGSSSRTGSEANIGGNATDPICPSQSMTPS